MKVNGFSLVELSIVLVILGLLTGGILAGQSLIRAAEVRKFSVEAERYVTAVYTFRDKYFNLPGDMDNATAFWGVAGGNGSNNACMTTDATGTATCDGDGDGIIGPQQGYVAGTPLSFMSERGGEASRFWQHLANAGLIEGSYSGSSNAAFTTAGNAGADEDNAPRLPTGNGFWMPATQFGYAGNTNFFSDTSSNSLYTAYLYTESPGWYIALQVLAEVITPQEAWSVDIKTDDGIPHQGKIRAQKTNCTTASGVAPPLDANAEYLLTLDETACGLRFLF